MAFSIAYILFWIMVLIGSFIGKVKGVVLLTIYIVFAAAMVYLRQFIDPSLASAADSALFLLLLVWIVVINKHSQKRRKQ